jgi:glyoxylase-like metal-dependent hydrolase (beta-lactamase superfamily II)
MSIQTVRIIRTGTIPIEQFEPVTVWPFKRLLGITGASSVTLIKNNASPNETLLVDTGFENEEDGSESNIRRSQEILKERLFTLGYIPDNIENIFITHWHQDHFGNLELFPNAKILTSRTAISHHRLATRFSNIVGVEDGDEIIEGVYAMSTPGHTIDHFSLRLKLDGNNIVVAGDAVTSLSYFLAGKTWAYNPDFESSQLADQSFQKIVNHASVIIPGHGAPFFVPERELALEYSLPEKKSNDLIR